MSGVTLLVTGASVAIGVLGFYCRDRVARWVFFGGFVFAIVPYGLEVPRLLIAANCNGNKIKGFDCPVDTVFIEFLLFYLFVSQILVLIWPFLFVAALVAEVLRRVFG